MSTKFSVGTAHNKLAKDLQAMLHASPKSADTWQDITPLARNEWICWIESAKQADTRKRRIRIAKENLAKGKRRPCCWAGCPHRQKNGK